MLVLGGYGTTGTVLAELLLANSEATVMLAGRDLGKAERAAASLGVRYPGRVSARVADAADPASLDRAFAGAGLVAVAASVLEYADIGGLLRDLQRMGVRLEGRRLDVGALLESR